MSWELAIQRKWVSFHSVKNPRTALILAQYLLQHLKFQCQMERQGLSFLHLEPRFEFIVRTNQSRIQLPARNHIMPTQSMVRLVWQTSCSIFLVTNIILFQLLFSIERGQSYSYSTPDNKHNSIRRINYRNTGSGSKHEQDGRYQTVTERSRSCLCNTSSGSYRCDCCVQRSSSPGASSQVGDIIS